METVDLDSAVEQFMVPFAATQIRAIIGVIGFIRSLLKSIFWCSLSNYNFFGAKSKHNLYTLCVLPHICKARTLTGRAIAAEDNQPSGKPCWYVLVDFSPHNSTSA